MHNSVDLEIVSSLEYWSELKSREECLEAAGVMINALMEDRKSTEDCRRLLMRVDGLHPGSVADSLAARVLSRRSRSRVLSLMLVLMDGAISTSTSLFDSLLSSLWWDKDAEVLSNVLAVLLINLKSSFALWSTNSSRLIECLLRLVSLLTGVPQHTFSGAFFGDSSGWDAEISPFVDMKVLSPYVRDFWAACYGLWPADVAVHCRKWIQSLAAKQVDSRKLDAFLSQFSLCADIFLSVPSSKAPTDTDVDVHVNSRLFGWSQQKTFYDDILSSGVSKPFENHKIQQLEQTITFYAQTLSKHLVENQVPSNLYTLYRLQKQEMQQTADMHARQLSDIKAIKEKRDKWEEVLNDKLRLVRVERARFKGECEVLREELDSVKTELRRVIAERDEMALRVADCEGAGRIADLERQLEDMRMAQRRLS